MTDRTHLDLAADYLLICDWASRNGSGETLMRPSNGPSCSKIKKMALPTETAQTKSTAITVTLRGANSPKLGDREELEENGLERVQYGCQTTQGTLPR